MYNVKDKVALVTGAGQGIGARTAELLAAEGALVSVTDVNDATGQATTDRIRAEGFVAHFRHLDVTREEGWKSVMDGVFLGTKYGIQAMTEGSTSRPKGGSIIDVSSVAGLVGRAFMSAYSMTKGGVRPFTKSVAHGCGLLGMAGTMRTRSRS